MIAATDLPRWDDRPRDGCAVRAADALAVRAADDLAVVPESVAALPAAASVELLWLDRP